MFPGLLNYHLIMSFPPFCTFAVFNAKRPVLAFVNNASIYLKVLDRSATIISLSLSPVVFYLGSTKSDWLTVSGYTKRKKKVRESELMFGCYLNEGCQLFYVKGSQTLEYVKTSQRNHIQLVTNILVNS